MIQAQLMTGRRQPVDFRSGYRGLGVGLFTLLVGGGLGACLPAGEFGEDPVITSEVDDWRDEVIYQLITDRFANGDPNNDFGLSRDTTNLNRYQGGDWQGIIDHADYLEGLGVTTIWISPIVANVEEDAGIAGYHGYWTQNFAATNPHMGDLAKLRELVEVMHGHGIKVVVDIVANHVGQAFYYDINQNGQADITTWYATDGSDTLDVVTEWDPAYDPRRIQSFTSLGEAGDAPIGWVWMPEINRTPPEPKEFQNPEWYNRRGRVTDWSDLDQVRLADFPGGLKDLATENPNVRRALIRIFSDWITHTNIDGYRIDTVKHIEHDFWSEFCPAIREHAASLGKDNFLLMGEVFDGNDALVGSYTQEDMLDGAVDFAAKYQVFEDVFKRGGATANVAALHEARQVNWGNVEQPKGVGVAPKDLPLGFLDNHDVARFMWDQEGDSSALRLALVWLMLRDGLPVLYYGTEAGFEGGNDPANREPLWEGGYDTEHPLYQWIAALSKVRNQHAALRRGDLTFRWTTEHTGDEEDAGILAAERVFEDSRVLIVLNTHATRTSAARFGEERLLTGFAPGTRLVNALPADVPTTWTVDDAGGVSVELGPREAVVLVEG